MLASIRSVELGRPLPASTVWTLERRLLGTLRHARTLCGTAGPEFLDERIKRTHVVALCASADGSLTAAATSDGLVEVHEPLDADDPARVSLRAGTHGATHAAWTAGGREEAVFVALANSPAVWRFDLERCGEREPSHVHRLASENAPRGEGRPMPTDLAPVDGGGVAVAATGGTVYVFDARSRKPTATLGVKRGRVAIASKGDLLFAGLFGEIAAYDRRMLKLGVSRTLVPGGAGAGRTKPLLTRRVAPAGQDDSNFGSVCPVPGAPAQVAFHTRGGAVGCVDLLAPPGALDACGRPALKHEGLGAVSAPLPGDTGLRLWGTESRVGCGTWWVTRHRACVVPGALGRGARMYAPLMKGNGFRVVEIRDGRAEGVVRVETGRPVACVATVGDAGVVVGYASSRVDLFCVAGRGRRAAEGGDG